MAVTGPRAAFLDRPVARVLAFGCFLLCAAALAYIHRDDLFGPDPAAVAADDPVARCFAERAGEIDAMLADRVIGAEQAALFKSRAEAMCVAQFGGDGGPGPPGLPPALMSR